MRKQIQNFNTSFLIIVTVFSLFGAALAANIPVRAGGKFLAKADQPIAKSEVVVVTDVAVSSAALATSLSVTGSCSVPMPSANVANNLLQNQGVINLNEPASCFTLRLAQKITASVELAVRPNLLPKLSILVIAKSNLWPKPAMLPAGGGPMAAVLPFLPNLSLLLMLAFVLEITNRVQIKRPAKVSLLKLTLAQLQILRC